VWTSVNPVLASSEIGYETDTKKVKFGDGVSPWVSLPYLSGDAIPDTELAERVDFIVEEIGDPSLLTAQHPTHDLVHWLTWLENRVDTLEAAGGGQDPLPEPEFALEVDNYGGGFIRVRDTSNGLADGQIHIVNMVLATVPGPGGEVLPPATGVPAGNNPTWFDAGGVLGYVKGATGTNVSQTTMRNWVRYSDPATPNHYILWVHKAQATDDPTKPVLIVDRVATIA
jgi:hypothetical protein